MPLDVPVFAILHAQRPGKKVTVRPMCRLIALYYELHISKALRYGMY